MVAQAGSTAISGGSDFPPGEHRRDHAQRVGRLLRARVRQQQVLPDVHQQAGDDDADRHVRPGGGRIVVVQRDDHGSALPSGQVIFTDAGR